MSSGQPKTVPAGEDSLTPYAPAGAKTIKLGSDNLRRHGTWTK